MICHCEESPAFNCRSVGADLCVRPGVATGLGVRDDPEYGEKARLTPGGRC